MRPYQHKVQYYETDKMGITHHSNYIRWMEEAKMDFLEQIGWSYEKMEEEKMISPVSSVSCKYKRSTKFPQVITIQVFVEEFKGVRLKLSYEMKNDEGQVVCVGTSENCFVDEAGKIIRMEKEYPEFFEAVHRQIG